MKVGRNDRCPCGSGQKFKKCCQPQGRVPLRCYPPEYRKRSRTLKEQASTIAPDVTPAAEPAERDPGELVITYDAERQVVSGMKFNTDAYKTWEFIIAVLGMAQKVAEDNRQAARMKALQMEAMRTMQAEQQAQAVGRLLHGRA